MTKPADVATAYIEAFGRRDLTAVATLLDADVVFESPRVRLTGAAPVLAAIEEFAQVVTGVDIIASLGDEEQATIVYDMKTGPFGTVRAVDHLIVRDGLITSDVLVFDTQPVRRPPLSMIRYATRPEAAETNQRLVEQVFAQLQAEDPGGVRYLSLRLADGVSFVHLVTGDTGALAELSAFAEFQRELGDRVVEGPTRSEVTLVGSYRFLG